MNTYWISLPCDLLSSLASFQCSLLHHLHLSSDLGLSKYVNQHSHLNLSRNVRLSVLYDLDFNMDDFVKNFNEHQAQNFFHPMKFASTSPCPGGMGKAAIGSTMACQCMLQSTGNWKTFQCASSQVIRRCCHFHPHHCSSVVAGGCRCCCQSILLQDVHKTLIEAL